MDPDSTRALAAVSIRASAVRSTATAAGLHRGEGEGHKDGMFYITTIIKMTIAMIIIMRRSVLMITAPRPRPLFPQSKQPRMLLALCSWLVFLQSGVP